jgi:hypothetical protein
MIKMAADGLTKSFTKAIFGENGMHGGQPSFFGGTIGKWMGGYQADQKGPYGSNGPNGSLAAFQKAGIDPTTMKFTGLGNGGLGSIGQPGSTQFTALWVKDANNPMGALGGAGGGFGLQVPGLPGAVGNSSPFGGPTTCSTWVRAAAAATCSA